jgi:hypothetical protein
MENHTTLTLPQIAGFTEAQIIFAIDEMQKGTDRITLQTFLYKKFGLYDSDVEELISQIEKKTSIKPKVYVAETRVDLAQVLEQNGYDAQTAKTRVDTYLDKAEQEDSSQRTTDILLGIVILGIGLFITFSGVGVIAYGAIIVGAVRLIKGLSQ